MLLTFKNLNRFLVLSFAAIILAACTTTPQDTASTSSSSSSASKVEVVDGVYVGTDTVEMLAVDVPDRVFFAYDSYSLTSAAQATLAKQAKWLKANGSVTIAIEGHADERGTREYNLALGDRRANAAKDYLMTQVRAIPRQSGQLILQDLMRESLKLQLMRQTHHGRN